MHRAAYAGSVSLNTKAVAASAAAVPAVTVEPGFDRFYFVDGLGV